MYRVTNIRDISTVIGNVGKVETLLKILNNLFSSIFCVLLSILLNRFCFKVFITSRFIVLSWGGARKSALSIRKSQK